MAETYTMQLEYKCGRKNYSTEDPAFMDINIKNASGKIITRCVMRYFRFHCFKANTNNWIAIHTDGKFHQRHMRSYIDNARCYGLLQQLWTLKTGNSITFEA